MGPYVQLLGRKGIDRRIPCPIWLQLKLQNMQVSNNITLLDIKKKVKQPLLQAYGAQRVLVG